MEKEISTVNSTYSEIRHILESARQKIYVNINREMVLAYWNIGKIIVENEQKGRYKARYKEYLLKELSKRMTSEFGKGFDESNLRRIRQFYLYFPKCAALRHELSWTHYKSLISVESTKVRSFYLIEAASNKWSTRELDRQINSLLYERLCLSRDKKAVMELSKKGQTISDPKDIIKDPYVLEFLELKEDISLQEKDLERQLIEKMYSFLLELGKGFAFIDRQKRITIDNRHYYIDLVFYNHILRCFVLIELKVGELTHQDIGQMDFYVRYYDKEMRSKDDNPTLGIIFCSNKNDAMVRYTLLEDKNQIFASKYRLYLPSEKEMKKRLL